MTLAGPQGGCTELNALLDAAPLLQAWTPLQHSRLWQLNASYWRQCGTAAFMRDRVPYLVTSDGSLGVAAAELLADLAASSGAGPAVLLEMGPGTGLFARAAMRHYQQLRAQREALPEPVYLGVDVAPPTRDVAERVLQMPGVRVLHAVLDLADTAGSLQQALHGLLPEQACVLCVFNYMLDSLPAAILRREDERWCQVEVELRADPFRAGQVGTLHPGHVVARSRLVNAALDSPELARAAGLLLQAPGQVHVPVRALQVLQSLPAAVPGLAAVLVNDYAVDTQLGMGEPVQYFGPSIAMGLSLPVLDDLVAGLLGWQVQAPAQGNEMIESRLFLPAPTDGAARYARLFSLRAARQAHAWAAQARQARGERALARALAAYESALLAAPWNWSLRTEAAHFALKELRRPLAARALAEQALLDNPLCAPAFHVLGDVFYEAGDLDGARRAFERALALGADEARSWLNLAYCDAASEQLEEALLKLARALAADAASGGALGADILQRQQELLRQIAQRGRSGVAILAE